MKGKNTALAAYGILLICLSFALGYLLGHGGGRSEIRVITAPAETARQMVLAEKEEATTLSDDMTKVPTKEEPLNINTAKQAELEQLPGIGPELAGRIIAYRQEHGEFVSKEQIMDVSGIGEKRFADMEAIITTGGTQ